MLAYPELWVFMPGQTDVGAQFVGLVFVHSLQVQLVTLAEVHQLITHLGHVRRLAWDGSSQPFWRQVPLVQFHGGGRTGPLAVCFPLHAAKSKR